MGQEYIREDSRPGSYLHELGPFGNMEGNMVSRKMVVQKDTTLEDLKGFSEALVYNITISL